MTTCRVCSTSLTADNTYQGKGRICRMCHNQACIERGKRRKLDADADAEEASSDEPTFEITETFIPKTKDHLYVMQNNRIPNELKVGRSHDPNQRSKELGRSHNFRMDVLRVYHACGNLEATVHKRLKARQVSEGDGQEWFQIDLQTLDLIIQGVIAESQL